MIAMSKRKLKRVREFKCIIHWHRDQSNEELVAALSGEDAAAIAEFQFRKNAGATSVLDRVDVSEVKP